jgi:hypothetical protein
LARALRQRLFQTMTSEGRWLMKRRFGFIPTSLTVLEARVVPSHGPVAHATSALVVSPIGRSSHALALSGTIQGTETRAGDSRLIRLAGQGSVSPLGHVMAQGTLLERGAEPTVIRSEMTLRTAQGSVTVRLTGALFGAESLPPRPITLSYTIVQGTGAFRGARGAGHATLTESAPPLAGSAANGQTSFSLTFGNPTPQVSPADPTAAPPIGSNPPPASHDPPPVTADPPPTQTISLQGWIEGRYTLSETTGSPYNLSGAGPVGPSNGTVVGAGSLLVQEGEPTTASGSLTLSDAKGSLTLQLSGLQGGPAQIHDLHYSILSGTGAYAGATGSGSVAFDLGGPISLNNPSPGTGQTGTGAFQSGSFSLTFGDAQPPALPMGWG